MTDLLISVCAALGAISSYFIVKAINGADDSMDKMNDTLEKVNESVSKLNIAVEVLIVKTETLNREIDRHDDLIVQLLKRIENIELKMAANKCGREQEKE